MFFFIVIASWVAALVFRIIWERDDKEFQNFLNSHGQELMSGGTCEFKGNLYTCNTILVRYTFCTSVLIMTFTRSSSLLPLEVSGSSRIICILLTLFGGWWGIPWGPIHSIKAFINCASPETVRLGDLYTNVT